MKTNIIIAIVVTAFVLVAVCVSFKHGDSTGQQMDMASQATQCCALVSTSFVLATAESVPVFFSAVFFAISLTFSVLPRVAAPLYHPPRY